MRVKKRWPHHFFQFHLPLATEQFLLPFYTQQSDNKDGFGESSLLFHLWNKADYLSYRCGLKREATLLQILGTKGGGKCRWWLQFREEKEDITAGNFDFIAL